jgi:hypothetical protein
LIQITELVELAELVSIPGLVLSTAVLSPPSMRGSEVGMVRDANNKQPSVRMQQR